MKPALLIIFFGLSIWGFGQLPFWGPMCRHRIALYNGDPQQKELITEVKTLEKARVTILQKDVGQTTFYFDRIWQPSSIFLTNDCGRDAKEYARLTFVFPKHYGDHHPLYLTWRDQSGGIIRTQVLQLPCKRTNHRRYHEIQFRRYVEDLVTCQDGVLHFLDGEAVWLAMAYLDLALQSTPKTGDESPSSRKQTRPHQYFERQFKGFRAYCGQLRTVSDTYAWQADDPLTMLLDTHQTIFIGEEAIVFKGPYVVYRLPSSNTQTRLLQIIQSQDIPQPLPKGVTRHDLRLPSHNERPASEMGVPLSDALSARIINRPTNKTVARSPKRNIKTQRPK